MRITGRLPLLWLLVPAVAAGLGACAPQERNTGSPAAGGSAEQRASTSPAPTPVTADEALAVVCAPGARAVVLNVWGTWCGPCREEFPDLVRLHREYEARGLRLVLLSVDFDSELPEVDRFLAEQGVDFTTYVRSGGDDDTFINTLSPRWSGALPATFVYDGSGALRDFWEGKATYAQMEERLLRVLDGTGGADTTEASS